MGAPRPSVWLVSPAWRRFAVTRLALAQRAHLATELAARGIDCHTVIVADDDNLDIARGHGFDTVEMTNDEGLGRKFNAGFQYAAAQGADYLVHIGSDDWVHPDAFDPILEPPPRRPTIITGRRMAFVDLLSGRMSRTTIPGPSGVIPWIIPRAMLAPCDFAPIRPDRYRGMDGFLIRGMRRSRVMARWRFHDPHDLTRVDFKSDVNINTYASLPAVLARESLPRPWRLLAQRYPAELVDLARRTHSELPGDSMPKLLNPKGRVVSVSPAGVQALLRRGYTYPDAPAHPAPTGVAEEPAKSATKAEWVTYATAKGVENADDLTKAELVERTAATSET